VAVVVDVAAAGDGVAGEAGAINQNYTLHNPKITQPKINTLHRNPFRHTQSLKPPSLLSRVGRRSPVGHKGQVQTYNIRRWHKNRGLPLPTRY
jgi:hypothetical protein